MQYIITTIYFVGGDIAENFRNRKGYFSLNVQVVCNSQMQIMDVVARWPGATHDSFIFNNSAVRMKLEMGEFKNLILLGDSGYPLRSYLLTPIANPTTAAQKLYNESHIRTRNVIERTFGVWKRRFPILSVGIRTQLPLAQAIVVACAVLQNIAKKNQDELIDAGIDTGDIMGDNDLTQETEEDRLGIAVRNDFVNYFEQLLH